MQNEGNNETEREGNGGERARRVLIVDDEEGVRITTAAILEREGYSVATARGGREALEISADGRFDIVLLDLRLEDMDGLALLGAMQARQPQLVAIVITGYASIETAIDALRLGVYDYLVKPCDVDDLKLAVGRALARRDERRRLVEPSFPVVEISDRVLLLSIVGLLDDRRAIEMSGALLEAVRESSARVVLIDITGSAMTNVRTTAHLIRTVRAVRLLGAETIITGVGARTAADLVKLGVPLEDISTRKRLAGGLRRALELTGDAPAKKLKREDYERTRP